MESRVNPLLEPIEATIDAVKTIADLLVGDFQASEANFQWLGAHWMYYTASANEEEFGRSRRSRSIISSQRPNEGAVSNA